MEERVEYDEVIECTHSYDRRCFTSLSTTFTPTQEEECKENYITECEIMTTAGAENVTLTVCRKPLVKDCDGENDEEICSTHYEAECITNQHLHQVIRKYCSDWPRLKLNTEIGLHTTTHHPPPPPPTTHPPHKLLGSNI